MGNRGQAPLPRTGGRPSGPQGTRLFHTGELQKYASEAGDGADGRASANVPVLVGSSAGVEGRRFVLRPGRQVIGRRADNDIVLDDPSVSASHAWITNQRGRCIVMNTLSTNGTFVNDRRIHEAILQDGDRIRFGQAELLFLTRERGSPGTALRRWIGIGLLLVVAAGVLAWWFVWSP